MLRRGAGWGGQAGGMTTVEDRVSRRVGSHGTGGDVDGGEGGGGTTVAHPTFSAHAQSPFTLSHGRISQLPPSTDDAC